MASLLSPANYDLIIDYKRYQGKELLKLIKSNSYDLVIELPQDQVGLFTELRNMLFFRMAGIKSGWGWQITTCFSFRQAQERNLKFVSENDRLLTILRKNQITVPSNSSYTLHPGADDDQFVQKIIHDSFQVASGSKLIAIVPGAKRSQNRYPLERFIELANWLVIRGYQIAVIGGADDSDRGEKLSLLEGVVSFCGLLTPVQSAALLSKCFITISNDTGPMHLSYAVGTPVIGLFSSRDFQNKWFPPKGNIALRNNNVHCSLCFSETCSNNICMQGIPLQDVKEAFLQLESWINAG